MRSLIWIGLVFVVLGIAALILGGISWEETETVAEIGNLQITDTDEKTFVIPPLASGVAVAVGLVLIVVGALRK